MLRGVCLTVAALLLIAAPAVAAEACKEPPVPKMPNGRNATRDDMMAAKNSVVAYVAGADAYQQCLNDEFAAITAQFEADKKPLDPKYNRDRESKINANQAKKVKLGDDYTAAAKAFNRAHPSGR